MTQPSNPQSTPSSQEEQTRAIFDLVHAVIKHRVEKALWIMANKLTHRAESESFMTDRKEIYLEIAHVIRETIREELESNGKENGDGSTLDPSSEN